jgi:hypothetical protein
MDGCRCSFCETFKYPHPPAPGKPGSLIHSFSLTDLLDAAPCSFALCCTHSCCDQTRSPSAVPPQNREDQGKDGRARHGTHPYQARHARPEDAIGKVLLHSDATQFTGACGRCLLLQRCRHRHMPGSPGGPGVSVPMGALGWLSFFRLSRLFFASLRLYCM